MDFVNYVEKITSLTKEIDLLKPKLAQFAKVCGKTEAEYNLAMAKALLKIKNLENGQELKNEYITISGKFTNGLIVERMARGYCYSEKLVKETNLKLYESIKTTLYAIEKQISALQTVVRGERQ